MDAYTESLTAAAHWSRASAGLLVFADWPARTSGLTRRSLRSPIQGRIYDTTGAAISEATVGAVNAATGF